MWFLTSPAGDLIYLKPKKELSFGRKRSDIILQNDESISRLHASIYVEPKDIVEVNKPISVCSIKDMDSKYGTYVFSGNMQIAVTKQSHILKDKDKIRFGLQQHIFVVTYIPILTVVSTLNDSEKSKLHNLMEEIDGMISSEWISTCTHLTVSKATLTEKVTWAMASAIPIVTMKYWECVKDAFENAKEMPEPSDFVPSITEALIYKGKVSLAPNEKRKTLFQNLIFVHFSTKQYRTYGKMISVAGGKSLLYTKKPLSNKELCAPNVVVLQYSSSDASQSTQCVVPEYDTIDKMLQTNKRRMVPESEIPLAILYCSLEVHCNPKFKFVNLLKRTQSNCDSSDVVVLDTQDVASNSRARPKVISNVSLRTAKQLRHIKKAIDIIPETCDTLSSIDVERQDDAHDTREETNSSLYTKCIPETKDTVSDSELFIEETIPSKNVEKTALPEKNMVCIPETNLSFDSHDANSEKSSGSLLSIARNVNTDTLKIGDSVTISRVVKEKSPFITKGANYIPETNDSFDKNNSRTERDIDDSLTKESSSKQSSNTKALQQLDELSVFRKLAPPGDKADVQTEDEPEERKHGSSSPLEEDYDLPMKSGLYEIVEIGNIIDASADDDSMLLNESNGDDRVKNSRKRSEEESDTSNKSPKKRRESNENADFPDNVVFIVCDKKRACLEESGMDNALKSPDQVSFGRTVLQRSSTSSMQNTSSFLRNSPGGKRFRKIYKSIPKRRITLKDMYVWSACNVLRNKEQST